LLAWWRRPLHALALPRDRATIRRPRPARRRRGRARASAGAPAGFWLVATGFAAYAFGRPAFRRILLAIFGRAGIDPATVVISVPVRAGAGRVTPVRIRLRGAAHPLNSRARPSA